MDMTPEEYKVFEGLADEVKDAYAQCRRIQSPGWKDKQGNSKMWRRTALTLMQEKWDPKDFIMAMFNMVKPFPTPHHIGTPRSFQMYRSYICHRNLSDGGEWKKQVRSELSYINSRLNVYGEDAFKYIKDDALVMSPVARAICYLSGSLEWPPQLKEEITALWSRRDIRECYKSLFGTAGFDLQLTRLDTITGVDNAG